MRNQAARREDMANARNGREDWADGYELRGGHHHADPHDPRGHQGYAQEGEPEPEYDPRYYAPNPDEPYGYDDDGRPLYYEPEERKLGGGRSGLMMVGIVAVLAALGGAGAVGYKMMKPGGLSGEPPLIKADTEPVKTIQKQSENQASNKAIYDRVDAQADAKSKMVSREEQPVDLPSAPAGEPRSADGSRIILPGGPASVQPTPPDTHGSEPRKVKTTAIRPTAPAAENDSRPPANDPIAEAARTGQAPRSEFADGIMADEGPALRGEPRLAAAPTQAQPAARPNPPAPRPAAPAVPAPQPQAAQRPAPAPAAPQPAQRTEPAQVAAVQPRAPALAPAAQARPATTGSGFVVQVTSQRSEADARTAYSSLQRKFPQVLGPYQPSIQTANVGDRGTYYRVRVGPFASSSDASTVCNNLRAAGGDCVVARN